MTKRLKGIVLSIAAIIILTTAFIWAYDNNVQHLERDKDVDVNIDSDIESLVQLEQKKELALYFTNKERTNILSETREIVFKQEENLLYTVMKELLKGPDSADMKKAIPEETRLISIKREGTVVNVNFSKEYYNTEGSAGEIIARYSVVNTLSELDNIKKVRILIEGEDLLSPRGEPYGVLGKSDVVNTVEQSMVTLNLYFAVNNAEKLGVEQREIVAKEDLERHIIEELIKGPVLSDFSRTVPSETKLLFIETKEGTSFVNLSQEFKSRHWGGSSAEILTIYSIVNSLTELPHVDKVQFLIQGQKVEVFEHMVFDEPFGRVASMIKEMNGK